MARRQVAPQVGAGGLAPWQLDLILRILRRDLGEDLPIADLAGLCGLSRSYFIRAFKVSMGVPPHRWLVHQRVRRAAELLDGTSERISAIAQTCGFSDQSHLARVFHDVVGTSPAAWRRQRRAGVTLPLAGPTNRAGAVN